MKTARTSVLALAAFVLVFVSENTGATRIRLLGSEVTMPLWTALLGTGAIGAVCGVWFMKRKSR
ncbi:LapA family protein [Streptomyces sp. NBC_00820]|nr:LapA family protein [Streptomyces sp. NBC_00820]